MEQSIVSVNDFTWDYAFLSSLPELSQENAAEIWLAKKDSDDPSARNDLRCLYARILIQNIKQISKRYGWDGTLLFDEFTIDGIEDFSSNHDLSRDFFWSDLELEVEEVGRRVYVCVSGDSWLPKTQYERLMKLLRESDEELEADAVIRNVCEDTKADEEIVQALFATVRDERKKKKEDDEFEKLIEDGLKFESEELRECFIMGALALSKRNRKILETYYGLRDGIKRTIEETAQELGVPEAAVQRVLRKVTPDRWGRDRKLKQYLEDSSKEK